MRTGSCVICEWRCMHVRTDARALRDSRAEEGAIGPLTRSLNGPTPLYSKVPTPFRGLPTSISQALSFFLPATSACSLSAALNRRHTSVSRGHGSRDPDSPPIKSPVVHDLHLLTRIASSVQSYPGISTGDMQPQGALTVRCCVCTPPGRG
jgi:hypothetical protein